MNAHLPIRRRYSKQKKPSASELRALGRLPKLSTMVSKVEELVGTALAAFEADPDSSAAACNLTEAAALAITVSSGCGGCAFFCDY